MECAPKLPFTRRSIICLIVIPAKAGIQKTKPPEQPSNLVER